LLLASAIGNAFANPPGGSYIQCDPKNPRSPVRCTPDGLCDLSDEALENTAGSV
jgi:hypothetical protein